jgi:hypothetical protein
MWGLWCAYDEAIQDVTDGDDDNYQHHGNLVQLLTYSENHHRPGKVEQVLL